MKFLFTLKSIINNHYLSPKIATDLFKKLIIPIGTYGSEIWGVTNTKIKICKLADSMPFEKVQKSFSKCILGVNKKSL